MITALVVLGVVCLALVALIGWREHEHRGQLADFADRIQAPEVPQMVAVERLVAQRESLPPAPDLYSEPVPLSDDLRLESMMEAP